MLAWLVFVEAYADYVNRPEGLFNGPCDDRLRFAFWEVIGNKGCANSEFRRVAGSAIVCDANLKPLVVVGKSVLEYYVPCFFRSESEECKILI